MVDKFDIDLYETGSVGRCNRDCSRSFMLLFTDGVWRRASFGGLSGSPMASCPWEGVTAKGGEAAYLTHVLNARKGSLRRSVDESNRLREEIASLDAQLKILKDKK